MDRYNRAYRDPKSPLTPLTPLPTKNAFSYDFGAADPQRNQSKTPVSKPKPPLPKRYSTEFLKICGVFERKSNWKLARSPKPHSKLATTPKVPTKIHLDVPKSERSAAKPKQQQQHRGNAQPLYRQASPIAAQPLSPRIANVLNRVNMIKYKCLFQREEIDIQIFRMLTSKDLGNLGITCFEEQRQLLKAIEFAYEFY